MSGTVLPVPGDASCQQDLQVVVEQAVASFGGIDIAYANAGLGAYADESGSKALATGTDVSVEHFRRVLHVDVVGPYILMKYSMPHMRIRGKVP